MKSSNELDSVVEDLFRIAYRVAYRLTGSRADAEDIAQEVCARAFVRWRKIASYADAWTARSASNLALDLLRRQPNNRLSSDQVASDPDWDREDLVRALRQLSQRQRDVIVLRFIADLPEQVVAERLGCSVGTVKTHAHRALTALRASGHLQQMEGI